MNTDDTKRERTRLLQQVGNDRTTLAGWRKSDN